MKLSDSFAFVLSYEKSALVYSTIADAFLARAMCRVVLFI